MGFNLIFFIFNVNKAKPELNQRKPDLFVSDQSSVRHFKPSCQFVIHSGQQIKQQKLVHKTSSFVIHVNTLQKMPNLPHLFRVFWMKQCAKWLISGF